jgi:hypothetical protein
MLQGKGNDAQQCTMQLSTVRYSTVHYIKLVHIELLEYVSPRLNSCAQER